MSFGFSDHSTQELRAAVTAAHRAGMRLFAAAGNDGQNVSSVAFPANAPEVFAIFASNGRGHWAGSINLPVGLYHDGTPWAAAFHSRLMVRRLTYPGHLMQHH